MRNFLVGQENKLFTENESELDTAEPADDFFNTRNFPHDSECKTLFRISGDNFKDSERNEKAISEEVTVPEVASAMNAESTTP